MQTQTSSQIVLLGQQLDKLKLKANRKRLRREARREAKYHKRLRKELAQKGIQQDDDIQYINGYPVLESLLNLHEDRGPDISEASVESEVTEISLISNKFRCQESVIKELGVKIEKIIVGERLEVGQNIKDDNITPKLLTLAERISDIQKGANNLIYLMKKLNERDNSK